MTEQEFDRQYAESLSRLDAWIATQKTEKQIFHANHRKRHVEMNYEHYYKPRALDGDHFHLCKHCGKLEACEYNEPTQTRIKASGMCFDCDYWEQVAAKADPDRLVIEGEVYKDGGNRPNHPRPEHLGFGGAKWTIERDGKVWETNNLWHGSTVPEEFRAALPDNAKFLR